MPKSVRLADSTVTTTAGSPVTTTEGVLATPTAFALNSTADTNAGVVKASAGTLYSGNIFNAGTDAAFVKLYNKATAPVLASDVPVMVIPVGASGVVQLDLGRLGYRFSTGIAIAITGVKTDTDETAVAAAQVKVALSLI